MFFFFFNDTATTEIYTLSLHDALPIYPRPPVLRRPLAARARVQADAGVHAHRRGALRPRRRRRPALVAGPAEAGRGDRKSTRLNSSHANISYAVFCLKKKKYTT